MTPDAEFATGQAMGDLAPFDEIVRAVSNALTEIGRENALAALRGLGIDNRGIFNQTLLEVESYARNRAAEMIGKKWVADALVEDPAAQMALTSLTEQGIGKAVANVLEAFTSGEIDAIDTAAMSEELLAQYAFSAERSAVISAFESRRAANRGYLSAWKYSGVITGKMSRLSPLHVIPDICDTIEALGVVDLDSDFEGYGFAPPWHPGGCQCGIVAVRGDQDLDVDYLDEDEVAGATTTMRAKKTQNIFELAKGL